MTRGITRHCAPKAEEFRIRESHAGRSRCSEVRAATSSPHPAGSGGCSPVAARFYWGRSSRSEGGREAASGTRRRVSTAGDDRPWQHARTHDQRPGDVGHARRRPRGAYIARHPVAAARRQRPDLVSDVHLEALDKPLDSPQMSPSAALVPGGHAASAAHLAGALQPPKNQRPQILWELSSWG